MGNSISEKEFRSIFETVKLVFTNKYGGTARCVYKDNQFFIVATSSRPLIESSDTSHLLEVFTKCKYYIIEPKESQIEYTFAFNSIDSVLPPKTIKMLI